MTDVEELETTLRLLTVCRDHLRHADQSSREALRLQRRQHDEALQCARQLQRDDPSAPLPPSIVALGSDLIDALAARINEADAHIAQERERILTIHRYKMRALEMRAACSAHTLISEDIELARAKIEERRLRQLHDSLEVTQRALTRENAARREAIRTWRAEAEEAQSRLYCHRLNTATKQLM